MLLRCNFLVEFPLFRLVCVSWAYKGIYSIQTGYYNRNGSHPFLLLVTTIQVLTPNSIYLSEYLIFTFWFSYLEVDEYERIITTLRTFVSKLFIDLQIKVLITSFHNPNHCFFGCSSLGLNSRNFLLFNLNIPFFLRHVVQQRSDARLLHILFVCPSSFTYTPLT